MVETSNASQQLQQRANRAPSTRTPAEAFAAVPCFLLHRPTQQVVEAPAKELRPAFCIWFNPLVLPVGRGPRLLKPTLLQRRVELVHKLPQRPVRGASDRLECSKLAAACRYGGFVELERLC